MSTPQLDDDKLQRYFDGELPQAEAEEVRRTVEASAEEQARLERLERLRGLMRLAAEDAPSELDAGDLFAGIQKGIHEQRDAGFGGGFQVIGGGGRRPSRARRAAPWVAGGLALAAAVLVGVLGPWASDPDRGPTGDPTARTREPEPAPEAYAQADPTKPEAATEAARHLGSEVVEVDFGHNTGTYFEVEGDGGEAIAVVWINDEGAP